MLFDELPKGAGVVVVFDMAEFVNDDIVDNGWRGLHKLPVIVDVCMNIATSPAGFIGFDGDGVCISANLFAKLFGTLC